jgi:hypothetical protein
LNYINLISGPRNISTAFMYSFAQRPDTIVLDEPFYAVYLSRSDANHPGAADVMSTQSADEDTVLRAIFKDWPKPVLFIKNMAHHIEVLDKAFLNKVNNVFLIRDPKQIISSYAEVIQEPRMRDIGIQYQFEIFEEMQKEGRQPVVIDSGLLLQNPRSVLTKLCDAIGIDFFDSMLHWPAGPKSYDGIWAPHWYANVHRSTGFERQASSSRPLPPNLAPLYEEAANYYGKLLSFAIEP